uniref:Orf32 n=1 Tax=Saccharopolyspora spinosa TaxID=60894 RepID=Q6JHN5_SACSN|nr:Orf32 [Saccharopolyspora spinosa NRRL 18395]
MPLRSISGLVSWDCAGPGVSRSSPRRARKRWLRCQPSWQRILCGSRTGWPWQPGRVPSLLGLVQHRYRAHRGRWKRPAASWGASGAP